MVRIYACASKLFYKKTPTINQELKQLALLKSTSMQILNMDKTECRHTSALGSEPPRF